MSEDQQRIDYCKEHNVHHLFELLATKVLVDRPENPFEYLRNLLSSVEESESKKSTYDPTTIHYADEAAAGDKSKKLKKITLGMFGLNNAGKTTLLSALSGEIEPNCTPTVGFSPIQFKTDDYDICIFDLGGAANFRGIWVHYFHDCHGMIYALDCAADDATMDEALKTMKNTAEHPYMQGKPLLVLCNKKDLPQARGAACIPDGFVENIRGGAPHRVASSCAIREDEELDGAVEWLLQTVSASYTSLSERVEKDTALVKEEKERKRQERLALLRGE